MTDIARRQDGEFLGELIADAGLGLNEAARFLDVDPRAVRRWVNDGDPAPCSVVMLLALMRTEDVSIHRARRIARLPPL